MLAAYVWMAEEFLPIFLCCCAVAIVFLWALSCASNGNRCAQSVTSHGWSIFAERY